MDALDNRAAQKEYVLSAAREFSKKNELTGIDLMAVEPSLSTTSDYGLKAVSEAVREHGHGFIGVMISSFFTNARSHGGANIAAVYDSELYPEENHRRRAFLFDHALTKAHQYIHGTATYVKWDFSTETDATRTKAKRFVAYWCAVDGTRNFTQDFSIIEMLFDENRDDHDRILSVVKKFPAATLQQVEHILSGEQAALSSGAL